MDEWTWTTCTDPQGMLEFLQPRASDRKLRLFACAGWRMRYTQTGPLLLRGSVFRLMLWPLGRAEQVADGAGNAPSAAWWGSFTFAMPEAQDTVRETVHTFRQRWLGLYDPARDTEVLCRLLRDLFGNPFRPLPPRCFPAHVRGLAEDCDAALPAVGASYPILADALEDLGEEQAAAHCREPLHVRGCHVLDWILGKE